MRQYERNDVYVDQCTECRGIFLDRGELERIIDAEARWSAGAPSARIGSRPGYEGGRYDDDDDWDEDWGDDQRRHQHFGGHHKPHPKKRNKSFLEGLFDD
jgi:Zn-finger nucleic acid-binding protein